MNMADIKYFTHKLMPLNSHGVAAAVIMEESEHNNYQNPARRNTNFFKRIKTVCPVKSILHSCSVIIKVNLIYFNNSYQSRIES